MTITQEAIAETAAKHRLTLGEAEQLLKAASPSPTPTTRPPSGVPVRFPPDHLLAANVLARREGISELEALRSITDVDAFRADIDAEKARIQARADAQAQQRWRLTPEGKAHTAAQAREARVAKAAKAELAREFLASEGFTDAFEISEDEAIKLSGIDRDDSAALDANDYEANRRFLEAQEAARGGGEAQ